MPPSMLMVPFAARMSALARKTPGTPATAELPVMLMSPPPVALSIAMKLAPPFGLSMTPYAGLLVPEFVVFPIRVIAEPVAFDEIIEPEVVGVGASEIAKPWK